MNYLGHKTKSALAQEFMLIALKKVGPARIGVVELEAHKKLERLKKLTINERANVHVSLGWNALNALRRKGIADNTSHDKHDDGAGKNTKKNYKAKWYLK